MTTTAAPTTRSKPHFDNGPLIKSIVTVAGTLMTIAIAVALFKFLTGLAPDDGRYRNIAIAIHIVTVLPCVPLGAYLLLSTKGTKLHKMLGKIWVSLMVVTAIAITFVRGGSDFSWIHIFVPITLLGAWQVVRTARKGDLASHRRNITRMYLGALMIPGLFAFLPSRLMGMWLFG
ncbi:DUF2306 domain-containing protein [Citromicrobium bathyomarinum]|uniref:DUF2306 domain-containing protein n=1 Tax=Citromicrobium bathyomarinum TaxID=72174 RepID=UPI00315AABC5